MTHKNQSEIDQEIDRLLNSAEPAPSKNTGSPDNKGDPGIRIQAGGNVECIQVGDNCVVDQRKTVITNSGHPGYSGTAAMLTVFLFLGVALAAWPFVKTLLPDPTPGSFYYKVPAEPAITPAALEDNNFDLFIITGCAHFRKAQKTKLLSSEVHREI